jgi:DNA-binding response OmpR family regulator
MLALLITADDGQAVRIGAALRAEDIEAVRARSDREGLELVRERARGRGCTRFDLALVDIRRPDITTVDVELATASPPTPLLRLAELPEVGDETLLTAVYRALGRPRPVPYVVDAAPFQLVFKGDRLRIEGERVHLSAAEVRLLEHLARRRGEVVGRAALYRHLFPERDEVLTKALDVYVTRARRILRGPALGHNFIRTLWGEGYTFAAPQPEEP